MRITGMDPAGPLFNERPSSDRLSKGDALFVDIIHSDMHKFGIDHSIGDVDFYPNGGGAVQPGCVPNLPACSHGRAIYFFIASINDCSFLGYKCDSYDDFLNGNCSHNQTNYMGLKARLDTNSSYYLETGRTYPFCLNESCSLSKFKYGFCTPESKTPCLKKCSKLNKKECGGKKGLMCCSIKAEKKLKNDLLILIDTQNYEDSTNEKFNNSIRFLRNFVNKTKINDEVKIGLMFFSSKSVKVLAYLNENKNKQDLIDLLQSMKFEAIKRNLRSQLTNALKIAENKVFTIESGMRGYSLGVGKTIILVSEEDLSANDEMVQVKKQVEAKGI